MFLLKICLFCAIVDTDKITRIPSELIAENSPACVIFLFFIENGAFAIPDPVYLLGVERASSSCSSGMLGMSGYSRSCADLSSLTRGKVLSGKGNY